MKLDEIVKILKAEVFTKETYNGDLEFKYCFASDLMSDALVLLKTAPIDFFDYGMLMTGLITKQSIRTAEMLDYRLIIIVRGKKPIDNVFEAALDEGIIVIGTEYSMFSASGRLFESGIKGISEVK